MATKCENDTQNALLSILRDALAKQRDYLKAYEKPSEALAFETLRTFDDITSEF
jgi:hypothetical protein